MCVCVCVCRCEGVCLRSYKRGHGSGSGSCSKGERCHVRKQQRENMSHRAYWCECVGSDHQAAQGTVERSFLADDTSSKTDV